MSEQAEKYRAEMRSKAARLMQPTKGKVDCSSWSPSGDLKADVKTGMRPVSPRAYQRGGAVAGAAASGSAARTPRKSGGMAVEMMNRSQKEANMDRAGEKHIGGMKNGGRSGREAGGAVSDPRALAAQRMSEASSMAGVPTSVMGFVNAKKGMISPLQAVKNGGRIGRKEGGSVSDGTFQGTRPTGGRLARKVGGRAKGKTHINIMINAGQKPAAPDAAPMPPPGLAPPHPIPQTVGPPPGAPPMAAPGPAPAGPAGGLPPQLAAMLGHARGGRAYPIDTGAGGGRARLDKIKAYGLAPPPMKRLP